MSTSLSVMKLQISVLFLAVPKDQAWKRERGGGGGGGGQRLLCARDMKGNGNKVSCIGTTRSAGLERRSLTCRWSYVGDTVVRRRWHKGWRWRRWRGGGRRRWDRRRHHQRGPLLRQHWHGGGRQNGCRRHRLQAQVTWRRGSVMRWCRKETWQWQPRQKLVNQRRRQERRNRDKFWLDRNHRHRWRNGYLLLFTPSSSATPFPGQVDTNTKVPEAWDHGRVKGRRMDQTQLITGIGRAKWSARVTGTGCTGGHS